MPMHAIEWGDRRCAFGDNGGILIIGSGKDTRHGLSKAESLLTQVVQQQCVLRTRTAFMAAQALPHGCKGIHGPTVAQGSLRCSAFRTDQFKDSTADKRTRCSNVATIMRILKL